MNSTTPILRDLGVALQPCLCGVLTVYASAQSLGRLDLAQTGRCEVYGE